MALTIEQQPLYNTLPVGQDIMFTLKEDVIVATKYNVKFVAYVYIDDGVGLFTIPANLVATLKVTPNNRGVGIFSLNSILESSSNSLKKSKFVLINVYQCSII